MTVSNSSAATRNRRVDFFRGFALMIIFINHMPLNELSLYTPSRIGFSDSSETFVFLSGFAAAIAFVRCFQTAGLGIGIVRILYRCSQIYLVHLVSFFLLAAICVLGNRLLPQIDYVSRLNVWFFFDRTQEAMLGLFSLRYVPNMFDILPMYLVIMLWIPIIWLLSRLHSGLGMACSLLVYACMWLFEWELPADLLSNRAWYFNPFAWQLMFFTGFAFGAGWVQPPGCDKRLIGFCAIFVIVCIPVANEPTALHFPAIGAIRDALLPFIEKSHFGILRWLHFLALAYLMNLLFTWKAQWLELALPRWIVNMGQRSLPIFLLATILSFLGGMMVDTFGSSMLVSCWINFAGLGLMLLASHFLGWLDSKPWKGVVAPPTSERIFEARRSVGFDWVRGLLLSQQTMMVTLVVFLAVSPFMLISTNENVGSGPTITAALDTNDDSAVPIDTHGELQAEDQFIWQDGI